MLSARFHNKRKTGELLSTLGRADSASNFLDYALFGVAPVFIDLFIGVSYIQFTYGWTVTLALGCTAAGYLGTTWLTRADQIKYRSAQRDREDRTQGIKNDSISQVELVKYSSSESYEAARYADSLIFNQRAYFEWSVYYRTVKFSQGLIVSVGMCDYSPPGVQLY